MRAEFAPITRSSHTSSLFVLASSCCCCNSARRPCYGEIFHFISFRWLASRFLSFNFISFVCLLTCYSSSSSSLLSSNLVTLCGLIISQNAEMQMFCFTVTVTLTVRPTEAGGKAHRGPYICTFIFISNLCGPARGKIPSANFV